MQPAQNHGVVLTCTLQGVIDSVITDDLNTGAARHIGESFVHLVDAASITKALNLLAELQAGQAVTTWEMNLIVGGYLRTVQFAGFRRENLLYIVGAEQDSEMTRLYEDLSRMNNEQITSLRRVVKEHALATAAVVTPSADYYDDLMRINNELVTLQRELNQKNRELERLNAQKNQLLGMVAHDLRNPLAVILDYSDFVLEAVGERLTADEAGYLTEIHNSSRFMLAMVSDLLDLSAVEAGRLNLDRRAVDLEGLTRRVLTLSRLQAEHKRMQLELACPAPVPLVWADEYKTQQVLNNLVSNAVKYSAAGTLTQVRLYCQGEMAVVEVQDHGQGIPADEVGKLFKPYSRTSVRTTGGESSTGLGLTICRRIIEGHGGEISVASTVGVGTTFRFTLPLVAAVAPTIHAAATPAETDAVPPAQAALRILVVEDSPLNRKVMVQTLANLGCLVDTAESGAAAIDAAKQLPYDIVFLDYHLPDMTAPEVAGRLTDLPGKTPRLFALTGGVGVDETAGCLAAGIEEVLLKPISRPVLQRILAVTVAAANQ